MEQRNYKIFSIKGAKYRDKRLMFGLLKAICRTFGSKGRDLEIDLGIYDADNVVKDLVTVRISYAEWV